jgi:SAM-dependent methyltransferase
LDWIEIGCGTGALSAAILAHCNPKSVVAIDPSADFVAKARANVPDRRVEFKLGDAQALTSETASRDAAVSALVLNFVPDKHKALAEMKRVVGVGKAVGFYVWDYPGGGVEFMHAFWMAAVSLDARARDLSEDRRFPFCTQDGLIDMAEHAKLASIECIPIEILTEFKEFKDFKDYWHPFTLGAGPAPGYCMSLESQALKRLKEKLDDSLPRRSDGSIPLRARAWAVEATVR